MSEPIRPRMTLNGAPRSAACRPAWIAGQVASSTRSPPAFTAAVKRGASPFSPNVTAERSEEHTSELQSLMRISYAVFCLKKKKKNKHENEQTETTHILIY